MSPRVPPVLIVALLLTPAVAWSGGDGPPPVRSMFATSILGTGDLGSWAEAGGESGIAAGDAICQTLAADAGLPNSGAYRAWLSDATTDAYCHLHGVTGKRADGCATGLITPGPWLRTDGELFSGDLEELVAFGPHRPAFYDENGVRLGPTGASWTGTLADGTLAAMHCNGWTGGGSALLGRRARTIGHWTDQDERSCGEPFRNLLCFETGTAAPVREPAEPAALVFQTSAQGNGDLGSWPQAGGATGLAAGDAICNELARAAGLPGVGGYVAFLSGTGIDAIDRIATLPGPWQRVDGVLAFRRQPGPPPLEVIAPPTLTERRQHQVPLAWVGLNPDRTCMDWTSGVTSPTPNAWEGWTNDVGRWQSHGSGRCNSVRGFYCFGEAVVLLIDGFESGDPLRWSSASP